MGGRGAVGVMLILLFIAVSKPFPQIEFQSHKGAVGRISTDNKGKLLLSSSFDNTLRLWNASDGSPLHSFTLSPSDAGQLFCCALSPDGSIAVASGWSSASSSVNYPIHVFSVSERELIFTILDLNSPCLDLEFSPDGRRFAAGLKKGGVRVYDVKTGTLLSALQSYAGSVYSCSFDFRGNLITADSEGVIRLYDADLVLTSSRLFGRKVPVSVSVSPDGRLLVAGFENPAGVTILDLPRLATVRELVLPHRERRGMVVVDWTEDGKTVVGAYCEAAQKMTCTFFRWEAAFSGWRLRETSLETSAILDLKVLPDRSVIFGGLQGDIGRLDISGRVMYHRHGPVPYASDFLLEVISPSRNQSTVTDSLIPLIVELRGSESQLIDLEVYVNGVRVRASFSGVLFELHDSRRRVLVPLSLGSNRIVLWARGASGRRATAEVTVFRKEPSIADRIPLLMPGGIGESQR